MTDIPFPTGCIPDEFDPRDRPLYMAPSVESSRTFTTQNLAAAPPNVGSGKSLPLKCPPIYNQGRLNSCTANAVAAALRYANAKAYGVGYEKFDPSRLFIYLNGRRWGVDYMKSVKTEDINTEKDPAWPIQHDVGAQIRKTIDGLRMAGVCDEKYWPYPSPEKSLSNDELYKASSDAFSTALTYVPRVINYYRIVEPEIWHRVIDPQATDAQRLRNRAMEPPPVAELQKCIDDGFPFIFGLIFYSSADFNGVSHINSDGVFKLPPTKEENEIGRHAVLAIGYDQAKRRFLIQNSWGTAEWPFPSWSDVKPKDEKMRGYCWMPYEWFEPGMWKYSDGPAKGRTATFTFDFWVIRCPEAADKGAPRARAGGEPWSFGPSKS